MIKTLRDALRMKEIRDRLVFTFFMLIVVRLGCQIPIPFVNKAEIANITGQFSEGAFTFFAAITGGSLERMSIFSLNITPYITSSIIMQLLTIAIPQLEEMQKDGEEGRKKIAKITRYVTVALAIIESLALVIGFANSGIFDTDTVEFAKNMSAMRKYGVIITGVIAMTAGSAVLMWIGEQVTEKGVGNGISIVLTINIISRIPSDVAALFKNYVTGSEGSFGGRITAAVVIVAIIVGIIAFVVLLQGGTRNIAIQLSQKVQGRRSVGAQSSNIPLKVNTAGVIPVIFASSILQFPIVIGQFANKSPEWMNYLNQSQWFNKANPKYTIGFVCYIAMIVFFAYFYTSITFNPREVAKNLNDRGGFIPGIRSGKPTVDYLTNILNYIILIGAIGLIFIASVPIIASGVAKANVSFGGTSIIIIVGVILETLVAIKSMMAERSYKEIKGIF